MLQNGLVSTCSIPVYYRSCNNDVYKLCSCHSCFALAFKKSSYTHTHTHTLKFSYENRSIFPSKLYFGGFTTIYHCVVTKYSSYMCVCVCVCVFTHFQMSARIYIYIYKYEYISVPTHMFRVCQLTFLKFFLW